jgi:hypothetical protein
MFGFFKKKKNYPPFPLLQSYHGKDMYFVRIARWGWLNKQEIFAHDPKGPRIFTFDPWSQKIFGEALGNRTVTEYIKRVADQYADEIPRLLDDTIIKELNALLDLGVIKLSEKRVFPEKQFRVAMNTPTKSKLN